MAALDSFTRQTSTPPDAPTVRRRDNGDVDLGELAFEHPSALPALDAVIRAAEAEGVAVRGLRWNQFLGLLRRTPLDQLLDVCIHVRAMVEQAAEDVASREAGRRMARPAPHRS